MSSNNSGRNNSAGDTNVASMPPPAAASAAASMLAERRGGRNAQRITGSSRPPSSNSNGNAGLRKSGCGLRAAMSLSAAKARQQQQHQSLSSSQHQQQSLVTRSSHSGRNPRQRYSTSSVHSTLGNNGGTSPSSSPTGSRSGVSLSSAWAASVRNRDQLAKGKSSTVGKEGEASGTISHSQRLSDLMSAAIEASHRNRLQRLQRSGGSTTTTASPPKSIADSFESLSLKLQQRREQTRQQHAAHLKKSIKPKSVSYVEDTATVAATTKPPVCKSRAEIEALVSKRLATSWGKSETSHGSSSKTTSTKPKPTLHSLIKSIETNNSTLRRQVTEQEEEESFNRRQQQWDVVRQRLNENPSESTVQDCRGRNSLHSVCSKNPPLDVVETMITRCGLRQNDIITERDKNGLTPLSIAIANNASYDVMQRLVISSKTDAVSACDHTGSLPIHTACLMTSRVIASGNVANMIQRGLGGAGGGGRHNRHSNEEHDAKQTKIVKLLLNCYPRGAGSENNAGLTPLHIAIENNAPIGVIKLLCSACPASVNMSGLSVGINPLMLAIRRDVSADTIRVMIEANPSAVYVRDRSGALPLRRAIEHRSSYEVIKILCPTKDIVVDTSNAAGTSALHETIEWSLPSHEETVKLFLRLAPEAAIIESISGHTPLTLACQRYTRMLKNMTSNSVTANPARRRSRERQQRENDQLQSLWNSLSLLIQASFYGRIPSDSQLKKTTTTTATAAAHQEQDVSGGQESLPLLHACVAMNLPIEVFRTAFQMHPEQVRMADKNNMYPLDHVLTAPIYRNKTPIIKALLSAYPEICDQRRQYHPSVSIPQHLSLPPSSSNNLCQEERSLLCIAAEATSISSNIHKTMYMKDPGALHTLDSRHRLYPFQVAALPKKLPLPVSYHPVSSQMKMSDKQKNLWKNWDAMIDEDLLQTNSIYELLLASPDLVLAHI